MRKNLSITKLGLVLFLTLFSQWCFAAEEAAAVAVIFSSDIAPYQQAWQGFKEFFEKRKIAIKVYEYNLKHQELEAIYSQVKKQKQDIILTLGSGASKLARQRITHTPVVFSMVLNPEEIVSSNITGVSLSIPAIIQLREIKRLLPQVKKIGTIYSHGTLHMYNEISQACGELDCQLISRKVSSGEDISQALKSISGEIDCFLMIPDTKIYFPKAVEYLLIEGLKRKFPVIGLSSYYTRAGALVSFECDYYDIGIQAGEIALKILGGQSPADILPVKPGRVTFSLNLLVAEQLGIEIPRAIIKQASEVFGK
ncbi:MAG: ABC transporter substrate-binding protein [bacterium]|nr:ABC transporter substrate-binding protein [bacterium]